MDTLLYVLAEEQGVHTDISVSSDSIINIVIIKNGVTILDFHENKKRYYAYETHPPADYRCAIISCSYKHIILEVDNGKARAGIHMYGYKVCSMDEIPLSIAMKIIELFR